MKVTPVNDPPVITVQLLHILAPERNNLTINLKMTLIVEDPDNEIPTDFLVVGRR